MCFNAEVSLVTYFTGLIGAALLFKENYRPEAIFFAWVIQMQLIEYFLWKNQPCNELTNINNVNTTKFGIIINHMEPIILWLAILYLSKKKLPSAINYFMLIFILITIVYSINSLKKIECTTVTDKSSPHLHWKWNFEKYGKFFYALFVLALVLLSYYGLEKGKINSFVIFISFLISYYVYKDKKSVGAMWCFIAAFGPWILLLLYKYL
jgi:hypothetical protein